MSWQKTGGDNLRSAGRAYFYGTNSHNVSMKQLPSPIATLAAIAAFALPACQNNQTTNQTTTAVLETKSVFQPEKFAPPHPTQKPKELVGPAGEKRTDPYYWLNERENPDVRAYLESENRYFDSVMAPVAGLQQKLFDEMVARVKQDDNSVPYFKNGYHYYVRFETGKEYPIYCRKKGALDAPEEIMLNVNELAAGHEYCLAGSLTVSPDNRTLFYVVDYTGRNLFKAFFKDLTTGKNLPDSFDCAGACAWANDSKTIFYDTKDKVTLRNDKIWRHTLGTDPKRDAMVYHETDDTQYAYLSKTKSEQYIIVNSAYTQTVEVHFLDANKPDGKFQVVKPRTAGFFYNVEHFGDKFLIRTNWDAQNFRLMQTPVGKPGQENWTDLLPHRQQVLFAGMEVFKDFLVVWEREGGLQHLRVIPWTDEKLRGHQIDFGEPTYDCWLDANPEFDSKTLRYGYSSLKTPPTIVDYHMETREKTVRKVEPVLGGFASENYQTEFIWATARDGVRVPVSLVYKKGLKRDGHAPCYLIGYGSYGSSYDPGFQKPVVSLLDRGFVFAVAHIRGGMEMGYQWYEDGKMMKKINTFTDFIDCADMLCKEKFTSPDRLFASGRSAGGLLMGAVANMAPQQFRGIIAGVPFVDVVTTMSDASIPLTTGEYTEWGNPTKPDEYAYMAKYSPYDNITDKPYPNLMITTSLNDSQVQYFEPAKWVAKMRDLKTNPNMVIFHTNMSGSHGGSSGRFERLKERAREYAWMMGLLGMTDEQMKN